MSDVELVITIDILRGKDHLNHCGNGVVAFCLRNNIDIKRFRAKNGGVPLSEMRATGEALAIEACEYVERMAKHGR